MNDTLLAFEESLEVLEKQRKSLELTMKEMGAECKESGWLPNFSLNLNSTAEIKPEETNKQFTLPTPLFHLIQPNAEPSHDYLQTLLNVNEEILAQSLAASSKANDTHEPLFVAQIPHLLTPPITPPEE
ncbi:hypothetical protein EDC96DRAFT_573457 [Choanephora cucurbitarum]|nr:hypothetical protein EDC96DRAFT_573457 [Choanephora cucurbitarum]